jgi:hypothetical protein
MIDRADPDLLAALSWRLAELAGCAGQSCRDLEDLPLVDQQIQPAAARP